MDEGLTCNMTVGRLTLVESPGPCGKKAKYLNPKKEHPKRLCGIHKNSVNAFFKRIGSELRCTPMEVINSEVK